MSERITVWRCTVGGCAYWRQEESTGVHQVFPGRGPSVSHLLKPVEYERVARPAPEIEKEEGETVPSGSPGGVND